MSIPASMAELPEGKSFAGLAPAMSGGLPRSPSSGRTKEGGKVPVNPAQGRGKDRNIRASPKAGLSIPDPENPYRCLSIQGEVVEIREEGAVERIHRLARRCMGTGKTPGHKPGEAQVIFVIRPLRGFARGE